MDIDFLENTILVSVKKQRNNLVTILQNVPKDKAKNILDSCRTKFGCGGSIAVENSKEVIVLQGDHKFSIEKAKKTIFNGFEIKSGDNK